MTMTREMRVGLVAGAIILSCITVLGNQRVAHAQSATSSTDLTTSTISGQATSSMMMASTTSATSSSMMATSTQVMASTSPTLTATVAPSTTTASSSSMQSCGPYLTSYIRYGAANDKMDVLKLQAFLNKFEGDSVPLSGTYDQATFEAVEAFQSKYASTVLEPWGISQPTGYVYLTTEQMINTLYCGGVSTFPLTTQQQDLITQSQMSMTQGGTDTASGTGMSASSQQAGQVKGASTAGTNASGSNMDIMGSTTVDLSASSSPVSNPFGSIGNFFHNLFSH